MNSRLETTRLLLRPLSINDAPEVQRMAGDPLVAATTLNIPHPYPDGAAEEWIAQHSKWRADGDCYTFAMEEKATKKLLGCIDLSVTDKRGILGYWIGKEYWNNKFCTEATKRLIQFAFEDLKLERVSAYHMAQNLASGKVMANSGMKKEGYFKNHALKNGVPIDSILYEITNQPD
jgi:ribosomal-protein-alanine N-acetyltransferase